MMSTPLRLVIIATLSLSLQCKKNEPKPAPQPEPTNEPAPEPSPTPVAIPGKSNQEVLAEVGPAAGYHYYATQGGNHPTIFLDRSGSRFIVVGREQATGGSTEQVESFAVDKLDDALAGYFKVLVRVGYKPEGAPSKEAPAPDAVVVVPLSDLFGSCPKQTPGLTEAQTKALYETKPSDAWAAFAGLGHPTNDAPAMGTWGGGLMVLAASGKHEFSWKQSKEAFAKFAELAAAPARSAATDAPAPAGAPK